MEKNLQDFPIDLKKFDLIYDVLPDTTGITVRAAFRGWSAVLQRRTGVKPMDNKLSQWLGYIYQSGKCRKI